MDYARLQEKYGGRFIARKGEEVVASAETHGELVRKLEGKKIAFTEVTFQYVRRKDRIFSMVC